MGGDRPVAALIPIAQIWLMLTCRWEHLWGQHGWRCGRERVVDRKEVKNGPVFGGGGEEGERRRRRMAHVWT